MRPHKIAFFAKRKALMQQYDVQSAWFSNKSITLLCDYLREGIDVCLNVIDEVQRHVLWTGRFSYFDGHKNMRDLHDHFMLSNNVSNLLKPHIRQPIQTPDMNPVVNSREKIATNLKEEESVRKGRDQEVQSSKHSQVRALPLKIQLSLCALCSTVNKGNVILKRAWTTLLYEGKKYSCLCNIGSVAAMRNASDFFPESIPGYKPAKGISI